MEDESSVSSKSDCIKALESLDLRVWLSHHNKNISKRYEHHERSERQRRELLQGLATESNPEKALGTVMELTLPRVVKKNGKVANASMNASACHKAVQSMLHDETFSERHKMGMHPVTLLAEQRRKIVLNALTDLEYPNEDKRISQKKLAQYIEAKNGPFVEEGKTFTPKLTPLPTPSGDTRHHHHHHHQHHHHQHHQIPADIPIRKFKPQWGDYDTMRTRWGYLQPQIRNLTHEEQAHAPRKSQKYIKVNNTTLIHGNVNDINHYQSFHERRSEKTSSVSRKTQIIEDDRMQKASQYYVPTHSVRY